MTGRFAESAVSVTYRDFEYGYFARIFWAKDAGTGPGREMRERPDDTYPSNNRRNPGRHRCS